MIELQSNDSDCMINMKAIFMGNDLNVMIFGGDIPHVGAVAVGVPKKSHSDIKKISSTVSVITLFGHKEDEIVKPAADLLVKTLNRNVVVTCGIHIDNISKDLINKIEIKVNKMVLELIDAIRNMEVVCY
ncbi:prenylated flavin chaperone LpdD [Maledivibacter halophilus]|uniref:Prenylated flavin chaperone LpdD-like domain-containing protein n=1 Tax=Maledivibacter halophilus TaxID=36842 RepID=A0A1T5KGY5_9FIRM|nr:hypothetical protein [Maledivibacter halophilus]SKC62891.1 hypothetical protein SAMN02194393_01795 [Maledivibacter halophilus]